MKRLVLAAAIVAAMAVGVSATTSAAGNTKATIRPIGDFVSAQGSIQLDVGHTPGGDLYVGELFIWGNSLDQLFRVDYAGTEDKGIVAVGGPNTHTTFSGDIVERTLSDGQAEDTIHLQTYKALAYMVDASTYPACSPFILCPAIFGYNPLELANGIGSPLVTNSRMDIDLVNTAPGAPIPDLVTVLGNPPSGTGAYVKTLTLETSTVGPLRAAFGVPDGTPGLGKLKVNFDITRNLDNEQTSLTQVLGH